MENVSCPICDRPFSPSEINSHVNSCLNQSEQEQKCHDAKLSSCPVEESKNKRRKVEEGIENSPASTGKKSNWTFLMGKPSPKQSNKSVPVLASGCVIKDELLDSATHRSNSELKVEAVAIGEMKDVKTPEGCATSRQRLHSNVPLAERVRPTTLHDFVGQEQVLGPKKLLRSLFEANRIPSMILWGPPGCGKTTLVRIIAQQCKESHSTRFVKLSATTSGIADVKEIVKVARNELSFFKRPTVLFVDEIHRFNKLQQDSFLPHVEDGTIVLIGATTENPSFQINNALLSRCQVITLEKLSQQHIQAILNRAFNIVGVSIQGDPQEAESENERPSAVIEPGAVSALANFCDGDARAALNALETVLSSKVLKSDQERGDSGGPVITTADIKDGLLKSRLQYDRNGEEHYNCASALQKSIRGSDPNAAMYWMMRMFEGGEDPLFIARRLVVTASEDIGLADAQALPLAVSTFQACQLIGKPECVMNLAHCVAYLSRAPKSVESTGAMLRVRECIRTYEGSQPAVPLHLRNASTPLMKNLGYGKGYQYSHNMKQGMVQEYMPEELKGVNFFSSDRP